MLHLTAICNTLDAHFSAAYQKGLLHTDAAQLLGHLLFDGLVQLVNLLLLCSLALRPRCMRLGPDLFQLPCLPIYVSLQAYSSLTGRGRRYKRVLKVVSVNALLAKLSWRRFGGRLWTHAHPQRSERV